MPKELLSSLQLKKGDVMILTEIVDCFSAKKFDDEYINHMQAGEEIAKKYQNLLRALAKEKDD